MRPSWGHNIEEEKGRGEKCISCSRTFDEGGNSS